MLSDFSSDEDDSGASVLVKEKVFVVASICRHFRNLLSFPQIPTKHKIWNTKWNKIKHNLNKELFFVASLCWWCFLKEKTTNATDKTAIKRHFSFIRFYCLLLCLKFKKDKTHKMGFYWLSASSVVFLLPLTDITHL